MVWGSRRRDSTMTGLGSLLCFSGSNLVSTECLWLSPVLHPLAELLAPSSLTGGSSLAIRVALRRDSGCGQHLPGGVSFHCRG